jgi:hypothetical protein
MHRGAIVEDGTHQSLLARGGYYARLHRHQLAGQQAAGTAEGIATREAIGTTRRVEG